MPPHKTDVFFGFRFFSGTTQDLLDWIADRLAAKSEFLHLITLNPELVMACETVSSQVSQNVTSNVTITRAVSDYLKTKAWSVCDGVGLQLAIRGVYKRRLPKITGSDLVPVLLAKGYRVYCIGGTAQVLSAAVAEIRIQYPNTTIVGSHHGYMPETDWPAIINEMRQASPDFVLVGMGVGKQERFLSQCADQLDYGVGIGIGGVLDVISGKLRRAPVWIQRIGIEWLFRACQEPKRIRRWGPLIRFVGWAMREWRVK